MAARRAPASRRPGPAGPVERRPRRRSGEAGAGGSAQQGKSITSLQRSRLIDAAVGLLAEHGYEAFSAAAVCERAGVSRRTFYEVFEGRDACLAALLEDAEGRVAKVVAEMGLRALDWSERIRMGLWAILCVADSDPALARVCLVESQRASTLIQLERERIIGRLVAFIDEGRLQGARASTAGELTAEALVGAVTSVIAARLRMPTPSRGGDREAPMGVRGLLGELTGMIVLPYLGPAVARREGKRSLPSKPAVEIAEVSAGSPNPLVGLPIRLTYRTARILQAAASLTVDGSGASNRQIAEHAGISDPGQASKLLWRLQEHDLLRNTADNNHARGEANNWLLTATGKRLVRSITARVDQHGGERGTAS